MGLNGNGERADGTTVDQKPSKTVTVCPLQDVERIYVGTAGVQAFTVDGLRFAWGAAGNVGDGDPSWKPRTRPVPIYSR